MTPRPTEQSPAMLPLDLRPQAAESLHRLSQRLARPLTLEQFGREVCAECRALFRHDAFILVLLEETGEYAITLYAEDTAEGECEPHAVVDGPDPHTELAKRRSWRGEPLLVSRAAREDFDDIHPFGHKERRSASLMFAPILWEGRQVGVLSVQSYTTGLYGPPDLKLLEAIADHCGLVLAHLRVERKLKATHRQLHRRTRRELRQTQEQLRAVVQLASDGIFIKDTEGRYLLANPAFARLFGLTPDQAAGKTDENLFGAAAARGIRQSDLAVLQSREPRWNELVRRQGPASQVLQTVKVPYLGPDGELQGVIGITRDVTEQRRAEERLRHNQERLELINGIARAIAGDATADQLVRRVLRRIQARFPQYRVSYGTFDDAGRLSIVASEGPEAMPSPAGRTVDLSAASLYLAELGRRAAVVVEDVGRDARIAPLAGELARSRTGATLDIPMHAGERLAGLLSMSAPAPNRWSVHEIGSITEAAEFLSIALRDAAAQRALAEQKELYETFLQAQSELGLGVVLTEEGRILRANAASAAIYGYSEEELRAMPSLLELHPPQEQARIADRLARRMRGEPVEHHYETIVRRKDGSLVEAEILIRVVQREPKMRSVVLLRDISGRKRMERQMQHTQKLEGLGLMAGGVAHDFNNLLMGILGHAGLALGVTAEDAPQRRALEQIENAARRAAELTRQLLTYTGRGTFALRPVDLSALVQEMADLLRVSISKKVELRYETPHDLPAVEADPTQIRQVIMNLITNANEAIGDGGGTVTVRTGSARADRALLDSCTIDGGLVEGPAVWLEAADTGCGMGADTQARIFDPFFSTKFAGRGLGMAAVLGIVRGHRGAIHIDTAPGRGTVLRVYFPASGRAAPAAAAPAERPRARKGSGIVLLADDQPEVLEVTALMLRELGYEVFPATDGRAALEAFEREPDRFDALMLDMTMPRMGGLEVLERVRARRPGLPVLLCSGYTEETGAAEVAGEPHTAFLQKPYTLEALVERLNSLIAPPATL